MATSSSLAHGAVSEEKTNVRSDATTRKACAGIECQTGTAVRTMLPMVNRLSGTYSWNANALSKNGCVVERQAPRSRRCSIPPVGTHTSIRSWPFLR